MRLLDIVVPLAIVLFVLPGPGSAFTSNRLSNIIQARVGEADPLVKLGQGTFRGIRQRIDGVDLELFLGVPFAKPPTGSRRFAAPEPLDDIAVEKHDTLNASAYGPACIQPNSVIAMSEDCLTINIIRAAGTAPGDNLPVLQWIYGGAFTNGSTAPYNGTRLVAASARAGRPIIYVSANYRIGPWGFLAGTEFTAASGKNSSRTTLNAGLHDQRTALRWTNKNIARLGGNPNKVTIWGQSAGAISVGIQLIADGGDSGGLFHAAFMQSGSPGYGGILPPTHPRLDESWKELTDKTGCGSATSKLECLRYVNSTVLANAASNMTMSALSMPPAGNIVWAPQIDGFFISNRPSKVYPTGRVADVPILSGDKSDEGTILVSSQNVKDESAFKAYSRSFLVINETPDTDKVLSNLFKLYPNRIEAGSPYTQQATNGSQATANASDPLAAPSTNQFKRLASLFGDYSFQSQRRHFLSTLESLRGAKMHKSPIWGYIDSQIDIGTNDTKGAFHGADTVYYLGNTLQRNSTTLVPSLHHTMQRALISFVAHHDPTKLDDLQWPEYGKNAYLRQWEANNITVVRDDFRAKAISYWFEDSAALVTNF